VLFALAPSASAANRIYWTNGNNFGSLSFANLDGTGAGGNLDTAGSTAGNTRGVAIDVARNKVFWTHSFGMVSFANLDGTGGGHDLNTTGAAVSTANGVAIDPVAGLVYWTDPGNNKISFARADNTGGGGNLTITGTATVNKPIGLAIDPLARKIYWSNANPGNKISFANLDGSGSADLNTTGATAPNNPQGVAIDLVGQRLFWASVYGGKISYARLDNTGGGGDINTAPITVSSPVGVSVDTEGGRVYWGNFGSSTLAFARLDNSGGGTVSTSGATANGVSWPALLKTPVGAGAPTISGRSVAGSGLSCSLGTWATDILPSFLFRAPGSFAFRWSRDGTELPGATANTLAATVAGAYRCTSVASNPAGNASQTSAAHVVANPPPPPVLSGLAIAPRTFRGANSGPSATNARKKKPPRGTKASFKLDEAATVRFIVTQRAKGRKVKHGKKTSCVRPTRKNRKRKRCTRVVTLKGSFSRTGIAGKNSFHFTGRLNGRKLKPGRYRLMATPTAGGKKGKPTSSGFRIVR
jgi:6-phosphogluconolactonase (cycloisomerase 2 family)